MPQKHITFVVFNDARTHVVAARNARGVWHLPQTTTDIARVANTQTLLDGVLGAGGVALAPRPTKTTVARLRYAFTARAASGDAKPPTPWAWVPLTDLRRAATDAATQSAIGVLKGGAVAAPPPPPPTWEQYNPDGHRVAAADLRIKTLPL